MFGFENSGWRPWTTFDGTPVLVPAGFNTEPAPNGDIFMYPEGDRSVPPSGRMPKGGFYFDSIRRQQPIDEDRLDPQDNLEEFGPVSDADLEYFAAEAQRLRSQSDRAILANFGGTAFGDIALVPAPWLKNPKGIRDVEEWYVSTASRFDYVFEVFERQCEIGLANLAKIYDAVGDRVQRGDDHRHRFRHAERAVHQSGQLSQALHAFPSPRQRLGPPAHALEDVYPHLRLGRHAAARHHRGRLRRPQSGAMFGRGHGPAGTEGAFRLAADVLGRRGRYAEDAAVRHAGTDSQPGARSG